MGGSGLPVAPGLRLPPVARDGADHPAVAARPGPGARRRRTPRPAAGAARGGHGGGAQDHPEPAAGRDRARHGDLLCDRRRAPAHPVRGVRRGWRTGACRPVAPALAGGLAGRGRSRLPGPALRPDLEQFRRPVQRRQPDPERFRGTWHPPRRRRGSDRPERALHSPRECGCSPSAPSCSDARRSAAF